MPPHSEECIPRAIALRHEHRIGECIDLLRAALRRNPNSARARYELAFAQLLSGNYADGFPNYESRWEAAGLPRPVHSDRAVLGDEWRGEPLTGKRLLLHAEQGFGDTIQFLRYAPRVAALGGEVTLEVQPQLRGLANCIESGCAIGNGIPRGPYDYHCSLMDLPAVFGTTLKTVPAAAGIRIPPAKERQWESRIPIGNGLNIGLAWAGNPKNSVDSKRSVPLAALEPILTSNASARFFSFQVGPASRQLETVASGITNLGPHLDSFVDTAAALKRMDRIVTVDTAVAHLAGSLGLPVWLLLPHSPCWRWLVGTSTSPWYPSMHLIRQPSPGDWTSAVVAGKKVLYNTK